MELNIYAIYDYKIDSFQSIFTQQHDAQAERMFKDVALDPETVIGRNPKDFALVRLGRVNTDTGKLIPEEPAPMFLRIAESYVREVTEKTED